MIAPRKQYRVPLPSSASLHLGERTLVMGILNVTPDSFADGGLRIDPERAIADGLQMVRDGADLLDIGGESTRPGAQPVGEAEELRRVLPVVERLAAESGVPISIDTYKANVAREAVRRGATMVNDISGLQFDAGMARAVADTGAAVVLMHTRGRSRDMYERAVYTDVVDDVTRELERAIAGAAAAGIARDRIIVDPGFGFAKRAEHSYEALARLDRFTVLDRPILAGPSRKSFLEAAIGKTVPAEREWGTAAAVAACVLLGAHVVRVHGVREMADVVRVTDRLRHVGAAAPHQDC